MVATESLFIIFTKQSVIILVTLTATVSQNRKNLTALLLESSFSLWQGAATIRHSRTGGHFHRTFRGQSVQPRTVAFCFHFKLAYALKILGRAIWVELSLNSRNTDEVVVLVYRVVFVYDIPHSDITTRRTRSSSTLVANRKLQLSMMLRFPRSVVPKGVRTSSSGRSHYPKRPASRHPLLNFS